MAENFGTSENRGMNGGRYEGLNQDYTFAGETTEIQTYEQAQERLAHAVRAGHEMVAHAESGGSSASVGIFTPDKKLTTAQLGDSPLYLFVQNTQTGEMRKIELTIDDSPTAREKEIEANGGSVSGGRVDGLLALASAFGDHRLKGVIKEPIIQTFDVEPYLDENTRIIGVIGSDGIENDGGKNFTTPIEMGDKITAEMSGPEVAQAIVDHSFERRIVFYDLAEGHTSKTDNVSAASAIMTADTDKAIVFAALDGHGIGGDLVSEAVGRTLQKGLGLPVSDIRPAPELPVLTTFPQTDKDKGQRLKIAYTNDLEPLFEGKLGGTGYMGVDVLDDEGTLSIIADSSFDINLLERMGIEDPETLEHENEIYEDGGIDDTVDVDDMDSGVLFGSGASMSMALEIKVPQDRLPPELRTNFYEYASSTAMARIREQLTETTVDEAVSLTAGEDFTVSDPMDLPADYQPPAPTEKELKNAAKSHYLTRVEPIIVKATGLDERDLALDVNYSSKVLIMHTMDKFHAELAAVLDDPNDLQDLDMTSDRGLISVYVPFDKLKMDMAPALHAEKAELYETPEERFARAARSESYQAIEAAFRDQDFSGYDDVTLSMDGEGVDLVVTKDFDIESLKELGIEDPTALERISRDSEVDDVFIPFSVFDEDLQPSVMLPVEYMQKVDRLLNIQLGKDNVVDTALSANGRSIAITVKDGCDMKGLKTLGVEDPDALEYETDDGNKIYTIKISSLSDNMQPERLLAQPKSLFGEGMSGMTKKMSYENRTGEICEAAFGTGEESVMFTSDHDGTVHCILPEEIDPALMGTILRDKTIEIKGNPFEGEEEGETLYGYTIPYTMLRPDLRADYGGEPLDEDGVKRYHKFAGIIRGAYGLKPEDYDISMSPDGEVKLTVPKICNIDKLEKLGLITHPDYVIESPAAPELGAKKIQRIGNSYIRESLRILPIQEDPAAVKIREALAAKIDISVQKNGIAEVYVTDDGVVCLTVHKDFDIDALVQLGVDTQAISKNSAGDPNTKVPGGIAYPDGLSQENCIELSISRDAMPAELRPDVKKDDTHELTGAPKGFFADIMKIASTMHAAAAEDLHHDLPSVPKGETVPEAVKDAFDKALDGDVTDIVRLENGDIAVSTPSGRHSRTELCGLLGIEGHPKNHGVGFQNTSGEDGTLYNTFVVPAGLLTEDLVSAFSDSASDGEKPDTGPAAEPPEQNLG